MKMRIIMLLAILFIIVLLGGCGLMSREPSFREAALNHLEQRYGGSFEFYRDTGSSFNHPGERRMLFRRPSSDEDIFVSARRGDDGFEISDNYVAVKYREDTINFVKSIADEIFGSSAVFYTVPNRSFSQELTAESTFEEYIVKSPFSAFVTVSAENFDEQSVKVFATRFQEENVRATFNLMVLSADSEHLPETITHPEADGLRSQGDFSYWAFIRVNENEVVINRREAG